MDGIHDLGGMDGFGRVPYPDAGEWPFDEPWEGVTYAMLLSVVGNDVATVDAFRHSIERMPPDRYLTASYYDRWVNALARLCVERGVVDPEAFAERTAAFQRGEATVPEFEDPEVRARVLSGGDSYDLGADREASAFAVGQEVEVREIHPEGHTRCPRYVRGERGEVTALRGVQPLPDALADGEDVSEPLYQVSFDGTDLWGDAGDVDAVTLDLWESYLSPADRAN